MCPCYSEMDVLFVHKPNVTPIASYDLQEKDSLNGDDDEDVLLDKENNGLESLLNLDPLINNDYDLVQVENLKDESVSTFIADIDYFSFGQKSKSITHSTQNHNQALTHNFNDKSGSRKRLMDMFASTYANLLESWKNACETSEDACLEWDRERWNEEKASNMEKQWLEELKFQKKIEFEEKQNTKKYEFEKEKWNCELVFKEKEFQMDLTIVALSSSRPISELERILKLINEK
ncbi:hypothetical protein O181_080964 [Austropuccinia psidii MF-1]|uniref:Uncharacterized protein n=1 Tax=Austropuccinia psidii MF-1 TaxID=1389203 RepID=A0A9Q3FLX5_9BASI|nr:hypothetical protein [Austropuccinia psidii MF-1]